ncbi:MAG: YihA family ribosome biogenesis GTP-binding protein [Desulfobacteraceae bacterium]|nr:MAG: YihA family ribosome biogenesis GTP-binding protein [Desulfobacteraceae bacterium]
MIIRSAKFVCSAVTPEQYPPDDLPEVAFAGRSNVGKSSLINKILNRKKLVRTSKTPGRTQLLNFFEINELWRFVDLPGYGYAKVPVEIKKRWRPMVESYLTSRVNLRGMVWLLDIRREVSKEDLHLWDWLQAKQVPVIIVVTKADKLSKNKRNKQAASIAKSLGRKAQELIQFSATSGEGKDEIWQALRQLLGVDQ